jgi:hypothetical protein
VSDYEAKTTGEDEENFGDDVSGEGVDDETAALDEVEPPPPGSREEPHEEPHKND